MLLAVLYVAAFAVSISEAQLVSVGIPLIPASNTHAGRKVGVCP